MFDLFDLNDLNSLSISEIEFMIYSILSSIYKLFGIKNINFNVDEIGVFVNNNFEENKRINIIQLINFSQKSEIIQQFFKIIDNEINNEILK